MPLSRLDNFLKNVRGNILFKINSIYGGVIVPRGTSIITYLVA